MAGRTKDKELSPAYQMESDGFYLLLRIRMEQRESQNINGVGEAFLKPETYRNGQSILDQLCKRDMISRQGENLLIRSGVEKALDVMIDSPHCMNFQNALLHKKGQILTFYYANGTYVGVLLGQRNATLVMTAQEDALYKAFEQQLEDQTVSGSFQPDRWNALWCGESGDKESNRTLKTRREARITHSGNRIQRECFHTVMIADSRRLQIIRGADSLPAGKLNRETAALQDWYGVICRELERLKVENRGRGADKNREKESPQEKSEYQLVTEKPGFPCSRAVFFFWSLKRVITGLPRMFISMVQRKSMALLLYPLWALFLFLYNLFITCFYNDTFMLDRRARLGNLSPYLMAATVWTPSSLKGLQMDWGMVNTTFLVAPLIMVVTLLLRHVILQLRQRKKDFLGDLVKIPVEVRACAAWAGDKDRRKWMWAVYALIWGLGFLIMNPVTIFLAAALLLLMFAQGKENALVQLLFLRACAVGRKKIDAGQKKEPDSRKYRLLLWYGSIGLTVYGIVSVLVWFVADYNWWVRFVLTALMILFALLQGFMPNAFSGKLRSGTTVFFLFCLLWLCVAAVSGSRMGVVFADDGGWRESGETLLGLVMNAGFSTILAISLMTIGLGLGAPLLIAGTVGLIVGGGTFIVGATDTKAGDYVRKSAKQYFMGVDKGESKTLLCTVTELLNFVSGFANPGNLSGAALKAFQGGKLAGDIISTAGDIVSAGEDVMKTAADIESIRSRTDGDLSQITLGDIGTLLTDSVGLAGDFVGVMEDFDNLSRVQIQGQDQSLRERRQELQNAQQSEMTEMQNRLDASRQSRIDEANLEYQNHVNNIQNTIHRVESGEITPPAGIDRETYLQELNRSAREAQAHNSAVVSQIWDDYKREFLEGQANIAKQYAPQKRELIKDTILKYADSVNEGKEKWDNLKQSVSDDEYFHKILEDSEKYQKCKQLQEKFENSEQYKYYTALQEGLEKLSDTEVNQLWEQLSAFLNDTQQANP